MNSPRAKQHSGARLRDELRAKIDAMPDTLPADPRDKAIVDAEAVRDSLPAGPERDNITAMIAKAKADKEALQASAKTLDNEAYENYMKGRDGVLDRSQSVDVGVPKTGSWARDFGGDNLPPPSK